MLAIVHKLETKKVKHCCCGTMYSLKVNTKDDDDTVRYS